MLTELTASGIARELDTHRVHAKILTEVLNLEAHRAHRVGSS